MSYRPFQKLLQIFSHNCELNLKNKNWRKFFSDQDSEQKSNSQPFLVLCSAPAIASERVNCSELDVKRSETARELLICLLSCLIRNVFFISWRNNCFNHQPLLAWLKVATLGTTTVAAGN
uniref:(northern house mosquito) hypothetical protein n=1 Tax=Culex pipiens TaxID=7175 RepID=A0A8D8FTE1_CULPI